VIEEGGRGGGVRRKQDRGSRISDQEDDHGAREVSGREDLHDPRDGIKAAHHREGLVRQFKLLLRDATIAGHGDDVGETNRDIHRCGHQIQIVWVICRGNEAKEAWGG
jgi:hypothetical protein